jgi:xylose isomerase
MGYLDKIPVVKYEGKNSKNPLAFHHYNPDEKLMGKTMKEHLKFAMSY